MILYDLTSDSESTNIAPNMDSFEKMTKDNASTTVTVILSMAFSPYGSSKDSSYLTALSENNIKFGIDAGLSDGFLEFRHDNRTETAAMYILTADKLRQILLSGENVSTNVKTALQNHKYNTVIVILIGLERIAKNSLDLSLVAIEADLTRLECSMDLTTSLFSNSSEFKEYLVSFTRSFAYAPYSPLEEFSKLDFWPESLNTGASLKDSWRNSLTEIKGITDKTARALQERWESWSSLRNDLMALQTLAERTHLLADTVIGEDRHLGENLATRIAEYFCCWDESALVYS